MASGSYENFYKMTFVRKRVDGLTVKKPIVFSENIGLKKTLEKGIDSTIILSASAYFECQIPINSHWTFTFIGNFI